MYHFLRSGCFYISNHGTPKADPTRCAKYSVWFVLKTVISKKPELFDLTINRKTVKHRRNHRTVW